MNDLKLIRLAGGVTRYHTAPTLRSQSVSEHSWGVAMLCQWVAPNCSAQVLSAALTHDLAEIATGDLPATIKWESPELRTALAAIEKQFHYELGTTVDLKKEEYHLLKWCDMMELIMWCAEEASLGNQTIHNIIINGLSFLEDHGHPNQKAEELYNEYKAIYGE